MIPLVIRRRPDGLTQIRRVRASDVVLSYDTATVLVLFAGFVLFTFLLFMTLVFDPPFLGVGLWAIVAAAVDAGRTRRARRRAGPRLVADPPPPPSGDAA